MKFDDVCETVAGPHGGYYVAAYAARSEPGAAAGVTAYYKVCLRQPASYFDADEPVQKGFAGSYADLQEALGRAVDSAAAAARRLPSPAQLAYWRDVCAMARL
jgi:hypothetical protein